MTGQLRGGKTRVGFDMNGDIVDPRQVRADRGDLARAPAFAEVRELSLGIARARFGFVAARCFVFPFQREQGIARTRLRAARDAERLQRAGKRRCDAHVLPFRITLKRVARRRAAGACRRAGTPEAPASRRGRGRH